MSTEWRVERVEVVDSTNRVASERVMEAWGRGERAEGIAVVAARQTGGKGQHGRVWESPVGGLYLSAVVERVAVEVRDKLALVAGVAAVEAVGVPPSGGAGAEFAHQSRLKAELQPQLQAMLRWPNDLMLGGKKVAGILCESIVQGDRWAGIVGIGVNVNTRVEELPAELRGKASSLAEADGAEKDLRAMERALLEAISEVLAMLDRSGFGEVVRRAREMDALRGQRVEFQDGERFVSGVAAGIGDLGEMLIRTDKGIEAFVTGSVIAVGGERLRG
ncbi:MAG TPA: biotin--[acetyl-CoA-carboxylase] ligase [Phycisphaerae bacterium]|nr:biotin--[acetyl-CoA-carboxylase] ligase [Phycisphaerae bacterium]